MIGAKLRLEAVGGVAEGRGHHTGVGDDDVEEPALVEQSGGAGADALEVGEIEGDQIEAAAVSGRGVAYRCGCGLRLDEIARCADDVGAVGCERASRLDAKTGGDAGDEDPFAAKIDSVEDLVSG